MKQKLAYIILGLNILWMSRNRGRHAHLIERRDVESRPRP
jgi:hypothetical protein